MTSSKLSKVGVVGTGGLITVVQLLSFYMPLESITGEKATS